MRDSPETPGLLKTRPSGVVTCFVTPCYHDDPRQYGAAMDPWYQTTMRQDIETSFRDRYHWGEEFNRSEKFNYHISASYVTGSHNMKMGIMNGFGPRDYFRSNNGDIRRQRYRNGVPEEVRVTNWPLNYSYDVNRDMGIYVQDTWTIDRLTLNLGLRWEQMRAHNLATDRVEGRFVPAAVFPEGRNLPNWKDVAPRLGLAYDVFGDASTALKVSWGRYNAANMYTYQSWFHPAGHQTDTRDWFDCALSPADESRCATAAELAAVGFDPEIAFGMKGGSHVGGPRGDYGTNGDDYVQDWEIGSPGVIGFGGAASRPVEDPNGVERNWVGVLNVGVERELVTGLSVAFNWYHRDTYDSVLRVNRALAFADYTALTIPNPCFENPNAGFIGCSSRGIQPEPTLQIWNLNPAKKGVTDWVVTNTTNDPDLFSEVYNGYETSFNARLPGGTTLFGGWTFERNLFTRCDIPHDPNRQLFCHAGGLRHPVHARVQGLGLGAAARRLHDERVGPVLSGAGGRGRGRPGSVGRHPPRRRAHRRATLQRQHQLHRAARRVRGAGDDADQQLLDSADAAGRALLRSADADRPVATEDVHHGRGDAHGPAARPLQRRRPAADHQRHQHLRQLAGEGVDDDPGAVSADRDAPALVDERESASRERARDAP